MPNKWNPPLQGTKAREAMPASAFLDSKNKKVSIYKAHAAKSEVLQVSARYTSQRCPKCGSIHKEHRHHDIHEYICDNCGYRSNDDRVGAMNIQQLGALWISGDEHPRYSKTVSVG